MTRKPRKTAKSELLTLRLSPEFLKRIDDWCEAQVDQVIKPGRAAAVRYLAERGLELPKKQVRPSQ